jgi:hypothetical protein
MTFCILIPMTTYKYPAVSVRQTDSAKRVILFAAPVIDIDGWAGVPQKKRFGTDSETVGFQREENTKRLQELGEFFGNPENIIQNPLLCATRKLPSAGITFESPQDPDALSRIGEISITVPDYDALDLLDILCQVREYLEARVPEFATMQPAADLVASLKRQAVQEGHEFSGAGSNAEGEEALDPEDDPLNLDPIGNGEPDAIGALFEESHIFDFWHEIAARHEVVKVMDQPPIQECFLGFTRQALLSYLRPVVLVDGQHRLKGALQSLDDVFGQEAVQTEVETRILADESEHAIREDLRRRYARNLPVSLMLTDDPSEQVFQFVIVNQKATPIGRALLGTIVATTLSSNEMQAVATRLKQAGVPLEESQAITYLARAPDSPFCGLVERGLTGDSSNLLQWGVFASLISLFRDLRGGKLYHEGNDYASRWRTKHLDESVIAADFVNQGFDSAFGFWSSQAGPWRDVFVSFFSEIRDRFGNQTDNAAHNFWGSPRNSNLFNKISLTILSADFFQFLVERKLAIASPEAVSILVDDWLEDVNLNYFNRDWRLSGVKKDATGIRSQWSYQWSQYRKNPTQLPHVKMYRVPRAN